MSKLGNTMKAILTPAEKISAEDQIVADALATLHAKDADRVRLMQKHDRLQHQILHRQSQLKHAALAAEISGQDTEYARIKAEIAEDEKSLARLDLALRHCAEVIAEAQHALDHAGRDKRIAEMRRKTTAHAKKAKALSDAIENYGEAHKRFFESAGDLAAMVQATTHGQISGGLMLMHAEIAEALALALFKSAPVEPTIDVPYPPLPGAHENAMIDPRKIPSFAEQVEQANAFIMQRVQQIGLPKEPAIDLTAIDQTAEPASTATPLSHDDFAGASPDQLLARPALALT